MDEVREGFLVPHENHWNPLAVPPFEFRIAGDVDLLELEGNLGADVVDHPARALAQVTARCRVQRDARRRYG